MLKVPCDVVTTAMILLETTATFVLSLVNRTGNPEEDVACRFVDRLAMEFVEGVAKVMLWDPGETVMMLVASGAGR
jgi:hypothetical protein